MLGQFLAALDRLRRLIGRHLRGRTRVPLRPLAHAALRGGLAQGDVGRTAGCEHLYLVEVEIAGAGQLEPDIAGLLPGERDR